MKTNYSEAWLNYRRSKDYRKTREVMKVQGIKQPCSYNILKNVFAKGWNATGIKIVIFES